MPMLDLLSNEVIMHIFTFGAHALACACSRARAIHLTYVGSHPRCGPKAIAHYAKRRLVASAIALLPQMRHPANYSGLLHLACKYGLVNLFRAIIATGYVVHSGMIDNAIVGGNVEICHWFLLQGATPTLIDGKHPSSPQIARLLIQFQHVRMVPQFYSIFINSTWLEWFDIVDHALTYHEVSLYDILSAISLRPNFIYCLQHYKNKITEEEYHHLIVWSGWTRAQLQ
jgi:hypothetical protein